MTVSGVVRWVPAHEPEEAWRLWLVAELALSLGDLADDCGPVGVRLTDTGEFPYGEKLRPPWPARLVVAEAEVPTGL